MRNAFSSRTFSTQGIKQLWVQRGAGRGRAHLGQTPSPSVAPRCSNRLESLKPCALALPGNSWSGGDKAWLVPRQVGTNASLTAHLDEHSQSLGEVLSGAPRPS